MGGAEFPPCWFFGLRQPALEPTSSLVGLMVDSMRAHTNGYFPELLLPVSLPPWGATTTPPLQETVQHYQVFLVQSPMGSLLLPLGSCTRLCVSPPRVESLFPPVLLKSCNQIPLAFKVWLSRDSSSHCRTLRLGNLTWGSETSLQWVDFCGIIVTSFWVTHPEVMGFGFIMIALPLPSHFSFSFVFGCGVSFFWAPVSSCRWLFSS